MLHSPTDLWRQWEEHAQAPFELLFNQMPTSIGHSGFIPHGSTEHSVDVCTPGLRVATQLQGYHGLFKSRLHQMVVTAERRTGVLALLRVPPDQAVPVNLGSLISLP